MGSGWPVAGFATEAITAAAVVAHPTQILDGVADSVDVNVIDRVQQPFASLTVRTVREPGEWVCERLQAG